MREHLLIKTIIACTLLTSFAAAHPLGNFSVNQYSRLEMSDRGLKLYQVLDLAEIPTFQIFSRIDSDRDGTLSDGELNDYAGSVVPEYAAGLSLLIDGIPVVLRVTDTSVSANPGEGGLSVLDIRWQFVADLPNDGVPHSVSFANRNNADRIGWNEIVLKPVNGLSIYDSNAFGSQSSDELKTFPQSGIAAPLAERAAEFKFCSCARPATSQPLRDRSGSVTSAIERDRLADLISMRELTPSIVFLGLIVAFGFGAMHAMSPGHGKTVVAAYLIGSKGTPWHALFLGLTVTITHTMGVFALGFATLFASEYILPERLMPFLGFFSGLIVLYIGLTLFKTRLLAALGYRKSSDGHDHSSGHTHSHGHEMHSHSHGGTTHSHGGTTHTHAPPDEVSWKNLLALGVSGGLLPCPSALVLMLAAINLGRIGYGLVLTTAFSIGLASTLTLVGLAFLFGGRIFEGQRFAANPFVKALPVVSAFVITCLGALICYNAL